MKIEIKQTKDDEVIFKNGKKTSEDLDLKDFECDTIYEIIIDSNGIKITKDSSCRK